MPSGEDNWKENITIQLNRDLLNYGNNLVLSDLKKLKLDEFEVKLDYNKIFNVKDEKSGTIFVRNIKFPNIFEAKLKNGKELKLPLDEINSSINAEYNGIKTKLIQDVLSRKELVLSLIKNNHISTAFLNKFFNILNQLVSDGIYPESQIEEFTARNKNFQKYLHLVVEEGFAKWDKGHKNLKASNKLKLLFKQEKKLKKTVEEALYLIVKNRYDYIVYDLKLYTLSSYVNIISCLLYLKNKVSKSISVQLSNLHRVYNSFYEKTDIYKFTERVNNLVFSDVLIKNKEIVSLAV